MPAAFSNLCLNFSRSSGRATLEEREITWIDQVVTPDAQGRELPRGDQRLHPPRSNSEKGSGFGYWDEVSHLAS